MPANPREAEVAIADVAGLADARLTFESHGLAPLRRTHAIHLSLAFVLALVPP